LELISRQMRVQEQASPSTLSTVFPCGEPFLYPLFSAPLHLSSSASLMSPRDWELLVLDSQTQVYRCDQVCISNSSAGFIPPSLLLLLLLLLLPSLRVLYAGENACVVGV
jgi:hypothetical protein